MPTTWAGFVAALASMEIEGVGPSGQLSAPPASIPELPCSFPMLPIGGEEGPMTIDGEGGWPTMRCELWIPFEAVAQNSPGVNFTGAVEMLDAVSAAFRARTGTGLGRSKLRWTLTIEIITFAGLSYWAVIAAVQGRG